MTKVLATWIGPYEAKLPDGTLLTPGESQVEVGVDEAFDSGNWQPPKGSRRAAKAAAAEPEPEAPTPEPAPEPTDESGE